MKRAGDVMQREVLTLAPSMPIVEIRRLFLTAHISGAPVVGNDGAVRGIVTVHDLLQVMDQLLDDEIDSNEDADTDERVARSLGPRESLTAMDLVAVDVAWVSPDASIAQVADVMRAEGVHHVLVGENRRLAGIVTAFDLLPAQE